MKLGMVYRLGFPTYYIPFNAGGLNLLLFPSKEISDMGN